MARGFLYGDLQMLLDLSVFYRKHLEGLNMVEEQYLQNQCITQPFGTGHCPSQRMGFMELLNTLLTTIRIGESLSSQMSRWRKEERVTFQYKSTLLHEHRINTFKQKLGKDQDAAVQYTPSCAHTGPFSQEKETRSEHGALQALISMSVAHWEMVQSQLCRWPGMPAIAGSWGHHTGS